MLGINSDPRCFSSYEDSSLHLSRAYITIFRLSISMVPSLKNLVQLVYHLSHLSLMVSLNGPELLPVSSPRLSIRRMPILTPRISVHARKPMPLTKSTVLPSASLIDNDLAWRRESRIR